MTQTKSSARFPAGSRVDQGQLVRQAEGLLSDAAELLELLDARFLMDDYHGAVIRQRLEARIEYCLRPRPKPEKA